MIGSASNVQVAPKCSSNVFVRKSTTNLLPSTGRVGVRLEGDYPFGGDVRLTLEPEEAAEFALRMRLPGWCRAWRLSLNGALLETEPDQTGYLAIEREWQMGDQVALNMDMPVHAVVDAIGNVGRAALVRGPLVYAADESYLPAGRLLDDVVLLLNAEDANRDDQVVRDEETGSVHLVVPAAVLRPASGPGWWREKQRYDDLAACDDSQTSEEITLVPFYEAGNRDPDIYRDGVWPNSERVARITYQVWLPYVCR